MKNLVYLGFGSNLGDRKKNILNAYELLERRGISILKKSSFYESIPYGVKDQPNFLNSVALVETSFGPLKLLGVVKDIEKELGRVKTYRWGPRVIDIDILFYDKIVLDSKLLTIPHKDLPKRCFVLIPLCELNCDLYHPRLQIPISLLLDKLECKGKIKKVD